MIQITLLKLRQIIHSEMFNSHLTIKHVFMIKFHKIAVKLQTKQCANNHGSQLFAIALKLLNYLI